MTNGQWYRRLTGLVGVGGLVAYLIYDLWAFLAVGNDATLSRLTLDWSKSNSAVPLVITYLMGVLTAHFFVLTQTDK